LVLALTTIIAGKRINWTGCTIAANIVSVVVVVLLCVSVYRVTLIPSTSFGSIDNLPVGTPGTLPDIYLLVLDTYPSVGELDTQFGVNNSEFVEELESRGLLVTGNYTTSYALTMFSLVSILSMGYPLEEPSVESLFGETPLLDIFGDLGYTTILLGSGWYPTSYSKHFDYSLQSGYSKLEGFKQLVLFRGKGVYGSEVSFRSSVPYQFEELRKVSSRPESTFLFVHNQATHPPLCFSADGGTPSKDLTYSEKFSGQLEYINSQVLNFLDSIEDIDSSIIIIVSDHGSYPEDSTFVKSCIPDLSDSRWVDLLVSRLQGFQAVNIPGVSNLSTLDLIQPNIFRTVLREYFNMDYPNLDSRNYFVEDRCTQGSYKALDVTNLLEVK
jgi:hypothetical protein